ncbi:MAG: putative sulfate exporter family transporter [Acidimicrobiales bacterium]|nr:putative sulfate exporter family transporter [Acidimicrobiales bacterium]
MTEGNNQILSDSTRNQSNGESLYSGISALIPGLLLVSGLSIVALVLGYLIPVVGSPVFAIVGGIAVTLFRTPRQNFQTGIHFAGRYILQSAIVVFGLELSFTQVLATGLSSLPVMLGSLTVALVGARIIGSRLSISNDLRTLIGVGTGICGASAIAATDAVISASEADVSYAVATIFTFNVAAVLSFPTIGHLLAFGPHQFGLWAGTAVNDLSSVVAATSIFGHGATSYGVVVKLTRTLMIIPITIGIGLWRARKLESEIKDKVAFIDHIKRIFPIFILWFLIAVTINTSGLIPHHFHSDISTLAQVMITMALAGIGLSTKFKDIRKAGIKPLALGASLWILVGVSSLGLQYLTKLL